jgi:hypothetical protein
MLGKMCSHHWHSNASQIIVQLKILNALMNTAVVIVAAGVGPTNSGVPAKPA